MNNQPYTLCCIKCHTEIRNRTNHFALKQCMNPHTTSTSRQLETQVRQTLLYRFVNCPTRIWKL